MVTCKMPSNTEKEDVIDTWGREYEYECDICNKPESEVGELSIGRTPIGRDYQVCKECIEKHNLKKRSDIDKYYSNLDKGDK